MSFQEILNTLGVDTSRTQSILQAPGAYAKNRIALIGTTGAGKSAHVAGLVKSAERRASTTANTTYPFKCLILENQSNIIEDVARLREGRFPPKTPAQQQFAAEAGLLLEWQHTGKVGPFETPLWTKKVQIPICDLAGEDLSQLINQVQQATNLGQIARDRVGHLLNYVHNADGYIIIIKATRARGLGKVLEEEITSVAGTSKYADANLVRILYSIINHKRSNPSRPIKGIAVVITAWDGLAPVAKEIEAITGTPFNPLDTNIGQNDLEKFVYACFPSTHAAIKSLGLKNIQYFPSFFEVERNSAGAPVCWEDEPGSPKIRRADLFDKSRPWQDNANTIIDSEYWFFRELDWLQQFATLG